MEKAFIDVCNSHAPFRTVQVKQRHNPWMTQELLTSMYERDYLNKLALRSKVPEIWEQYPIARNNVVHAITDAKKAYYSEQVTLTSGDKTGMWKTLKHILGSGKASAPIRISPEIFNEFFTNVDTSLASKLPDVPYVWNLPWSIHEFVLNSVSIDFVYNQPTERKVQL